VLRLTPGKVDSNLKWLQLAAGGIPRQKVVRALQSWPQLATTSRATLQERCVVGQRGVGRRRLAPTRKVLELHCALRSLQAHVTRAQACQARAKPPAATQPPPPDRATPLPLPRPPPAPPAPPASYKCLQRLLDASPAEMQRVVAVYPNMLARDEGALKANISSLRSLLRVDEATMRRLVLREPGLLSYNMSTIAMRWSYAMQARRGCGEGACAAGRRAVGLWGQGGRRPEPRLGDPCRRQLPCSVC
jgi:hypothetical protein